MNEFIYPRTLAFPVMMDAATAGGFYVECMDETKDDTNGFSIDASGVEYISTPAIQVLLSLALSCQAEGKPFCMQNASSAFREAFEDLGLTETLQAWSV